ncbi:MAG: bifunctional diaminohydroxyphosphoribosylaminopyrimidine deaminase/5-amino-6-(5-phosphoribosylamino)uracil reductase RibD [Syntrophomonadaceae bacterium]|jgi:diaminohydroxyphosphoribosylaminopyrimidine deaminase/5-amino-6-(5-phosphoribosylamino)uracil reductase|nr:bifunctional diaminohydroxyphosphoribosylaminopyrimidine deaminase/5-amino-6-(5-phosphoribosylamino)uracil reductase RibD [Syntrophomonadaceae bacterium]
MQNHEDELYMSYAVELAKKAWGRTSPNPIVGAVIVKDGRVVGRGFHEKAGSAHAEVNALKEAGEQARGAQVYITLEPCCHYGRTPPCTEALIKAGVRKAVIAMLDPNPLVAGKGKVKLEEAGVTVQVGVLEKEARSMNEFYLKFIERGTPFVTLKTAMTLDGKIASYTGDSRWISGEKSRRYVHHLRNIYDGVMVGIGTVLADDPSLNTRLGEQKQRDPARVIVDASLRLPVESKIAQSSKLQPTYIICAEGQSQKRMHDLEQLGIKIIECRGDESNLSLTTALAELAKQGIISILLEGGAALNASMLEQRLVDKVHWFIAPKIMGGKGAFSPVAGIGATSVSRALNIENMSIQQMDKDIMITGYLRW